MSLRGASWFPVLVLVVCVDREGACFVSCSLPGNLCVPRRTCVHGSLDVRIANGLFGIDSE